MFTFVNFYVILDILLMTLKGIIMSNNKNSIAEKIKYYRSIKKMSQEELSQLCGINVSTIKKYECGIRNPKPEQLNKIAIALGVSINSFISYDISSVRDIISTIVKLDEQAPMDITAKKDEDGKYLSDTVKITFSDKKINDILALYLQYKDSAVTEHTDKDYSSFMYYFENILIDIEKNKGKM